MSSSLSSVPEEKTALLLARPSGIQTKEEENSLPSEEGRTKAPMNNEMEDNPSSTNLRDDHPTNSQPHNSVNTMADEASVQEIGGASHAVVGNKQYFLL